MIFADGRGLCRGCCLQFLCMYEKTEGEKVMEPKTIISIALAVFILGGLVFLHIRASKRK